MSKHTPGPWEVDGTKAFGVYGVWTAYGDHPGHDGSLYPSQICSVLDGGVPRVEDQERRDANARLIAAAPELLDLLRLAGDVIDDSLEEKPARHELGGLHARIRTAIAKATGVKP